MSAATPEAPGRPAHLAAEPPAGPPAPPAPAPGPGAPGPIQPPPPPVDPPGPPAPPREQGPGRVVEGAAKLVAEGKPLTLTDGSVVQIKYGMRSLLELERRFGGLSQIQTAISDDGTGKMVEPSLQLLSCGLLHAHDAQGAPLTVDKLADLLAPADFQEAVQTAAAAMSEAFPTPAAAPAAPEPSPGAPGTTAPPSPSAEPTSSSGG